MKFLKGFKDCKRFSKVFMFLIFHKNLHIACSYLVYKSSLNSDSLWYQHWGTFTNMNIFGSILSKKAMIKRTSGGDGCDSPGDYLGFVNLLKCMNKNSLLDGTK